MSLCCHASTGKAALGNLFDPPQPAADADEIVLLSTRALGTQCDEDRMGERLICSRYEVNKQGQSSWQVMDWREIPSSTAPHPTLIYVHGNRVWPGRDQTDGLKVYRSLKSSGQFRQPIRYMIWSWPATPIPGPIKDYRLKASQTPSVSWQLAWFIDRLPADTQLVLVGYSHGARVACGAMHLLGGGELDGRPLTKRQNPQCRPIQVALLAAAYDDDWIEPGSRYGKAIAQMQQLVVVTNKLDPAMRFYHLSNGRGRKHALGKQGVANPGRLGQAAKKITQLNVTEQVGRSHSLMDYLDDTEGMVTLWRLISGALKLPQPDSSVASL